MISDVLIDTNVLVYAFDPSAPGKQRQSASTLDQLAGIGRGCLSTQVLGEFFRVTTEKLAARLSAAEAYRQVARLTEAWPVLSVTPLIAVEAARGVRDLRLAYWDAQLWATARLNQIQVVLSEDFQDGRVLEGVRFLNPFAPSFDFATLP